LSQEFRVEILQAAPCHRNLNGIAFEIKMSDMQNVLVAGATGYLGRFVTREFKRRGYNVRVLARTPEKLEHPGPFLEPPVKDFADNIFPGEVNRPETLRGLCDGIDIVFSSIGITRQKDKVSYWDVDFQGNRTILDLALRASVKKFIFVSVFNARLLPRIPMVDAREEFVRQLKATGLDYSIIRPTGYFSDMTEFLKMALSGRIYLIGDGMKRLNPIHGADLAKVCVDAVSSPRAEIAAGGPGTYIHNEIADIAFSAGEKTPHITRIPPWLVNVAVRLIPPYFEHSYSLAAFFASSMLLDFAAPETGTHFLGDYFKEVLPCLL
jgi:uncharacterized protein YbjT (DUF2867 family)